MIRKLSFTVAFAFALTLSTALAQSNPLRGTWSGHWNPESGGRDAVTVRFSIDDDGLVGELVNPRSLKFDHVRFDSADLSVSAEASGGDSGPVRIDARIEEETRLNGTIAFGEESGELRLTKWTFVPRSR